MAAHEGNQRSATISLTQSTARYLSGARAPYSRYTLEPSTRL